MPFSYGLAIVCSKENGQEETGNWRAIRCLAGLWVGSYAALVTLDISRANYRIMANNSSASFSPDSRFRRFKARPCFYWNILSTHMWNQTVKHRKP